MAEARAAVSVIAEHAGSQLELEVPQGTEIREIWELASPHLRIPEDVEAYLDGQVNPRKFGLRWNHPLHHPVRLVFAQYAYASD